MSDESVGGPVDRDVRRQDVYAADVLDVLWKQGHKAYAAASAYNEAVENEIDRLRAEGEALRADLARVSAEMGLPPGIGPAPGEIARLMAMLTPNAALCGHREGETK